MVIVVETGFSIWGTLGTARGALGVGNPIVDKADLDRSTLNQADRQAMVEAVLAGSVGVRTVAVQTTETGGRQGANSGARVNIAMENVSKCQNRS